MKQYIIVILLFFCLVPAPAASYKQSPEYQVLRDSMTRAFNDGDSARFFPALTNLQDYLLRQGDLHAYYTQRCNEIIFLMNRQRIFEAYKLAQSLAQELREKKLDKEMYMAYNMLGHLNRYCGNKETAKDIFRQVIRMMEEAGYYESMPPIYMNIVNVSIDDDPEEARQMLDKALTIAEKYAPDRVFDIETRKWLSYFNAGDMEHFVEGYKKYREGVAQGKSSVHGRSMEIYYEAYQGNTDKAVEMARKELGEDGYETLVMIYERAQRWQEAFEALKNETQARDSTNNVILSNTLQGYRDALTEYEAERNTAKVLTITMGVIIVLLLLLMMAMAYITWSRRRHLKELKTAYERALEADKMKAAFLQNMSHEVRTPLNIIAGFAQVLANPDLSPDAEKRKEMAHLIQKNNYLITSLIDEMLELAFNESTGVVAQEDTVVVNNLLEKMAQEKRQFITDDVSMVVKSLLPPDFTVVTNRDMLRRALVTLVDNAIKYTQQGTIILEAATTDSGHLRIAVTDTGSGIPAAEAERIFERFVKLDNFKEGIGLGLTLCRSLMTRLGGTIRLDTSYQKGARFVIELKR